MRETKIPGLNTLDAGDFSDGDIVQEWEPILSIRTDNSGRIVLYEDQAERVICGLYDETADPEGTEIPISEFFAEAVRKFIADPTQIFG